MKKSVLFISFLLLVFSISYSKKNIETSTDPVYGFGISHINTGTGHGIGYTLSASVLKGRKSLEVGLIYSDRESKIGGGDFQYKIYLGNISRVNDSHKRLKPYLQYNLVYQRGTSYSNNVVTLNNKSYEMESEPGKIATIGHYLGYGNKISLSGKVYIDSFLGFGFYIGSLDKTRHPDTFGIHNENNGFTYSIKVGISYIFN